jgi:hypothetical protein
MVKRRRVSTTFGCSVGVSATRKRCRTASTATTTTTDKAADERRNDQEVSLGSSIDQAILWAEFVALLKHGATGSYTSNTSIQQALNLGPSLLKCGGSLDLVETPNSSEALCNWVRAVSTKGGPSSVSDEERRKTANGLWEILEAGGARTRINFRSHLLHSDGLYYAPLHTVFGFGSVHALEILLKLPETDVNLRMVPSLETAAMYAIGRMATWSWQCFELLVRMRLLDLDLDAKANDGLTTQQKIDAIPEVDVASFKIRATWNGAMYWLRHHYYPAIHQHLKTHTPLLHDLVGLVSAFLQPLSLLPLLTATAATNSTG